MKRLSELDPSAPTGPVIESMKDILGQLSKDALSTKAMFERDEHIDCISAAVEALETSLAIVRTSVTLFCLVSVVGEKIDGRPKEE